MEKSKFVVKVTNHSKIDGRVAYFLSIESDGKVIISLYKRYSELKTLNDLLRKDTTSNSFPKFPPKKFFGFNTEEFITKRQQELNVYFTSISNSPEFSKLPSFIKFIKECIKSQNDNKLMSERPTMISGNQITPQKKEKSTIDSFREKFRPEKMECKILSDQELKIQDEEFLKIVNDFKNKFIEIDFQVKQNMSEQKGKKYEKIVKDNNILINEEDNKLNGNDENFNLISDNCDNINEFEKKIKQKMDEIIYREKEICSIYDINEILKTL